MIAYDRLSLIIPSDQALANKALSVSLEQISGVQNMTLATLANTVANLQTTNNLNQISSLSQAVPSSVANSIANIAGTNGTPIGVCDVLGIAAGYNVVQPLNDTVSTLSNMNVSYLTKIYQTMNTVVNGGYGDPVNGPITIPVGTPAAGTYYADVGNSFTASDVAMTGVGGTPTPTGPGLIPVAQTEIGNIVSTDTSQVSELNTYFNLLGGQIVGEKKYQAQAQINFNTLVANNLPSVYSLVYALPTYGQQTESGGQAQFWEGVANVSTFTGQSIVAAIREGSNQQNLNNAGIATNATVPANPNPPLQPANLIPSTYTAQQAAANVIV